jgi:hypothetical protein
MKFKVNGKNRIFSTTLIVLVIITSLGIFSGPVHAGNIQVPGNYPTIQAAINAAVSGDVVIVSPGTYNENVVIAGKTITLTSLYYTTGDRQYIDSTIIDGQLLGPVIQVDSTSGPETTIQGLSIHNGLDGIRASVKLNIFDNHFIGNDDGIDFTNSGGVVRGNIFENSIDDGIDFDMFSEGLVEYNIIRNNHEDGIEIRFQDYTGPMLNFTIRNNQITGNGQNGIQLIGYPTTTNRVINIEHNLIKDNARVGVGLMDNAQSGEDYRAASLLERINLFNNTFVGNKYAVTGGDNLVAVNNIFAGSTTLGLKNIDGNSAIAYNLFWNNTSDFSGSNVDLNTTLFGNPLLDPDFYLQYGSPAINAGTTHYDFQGSPVLDYPPGTYFGAAPDLGWVESNYLNEPTAANTPTITPTSTPRPGDTFTFAPLDDASIYNAYPSNNYGSAATINVDNSPIQHFLIKFQVDGLGGRQVTKATLRLYNINESSKGGDFYRVLDQSWTEETVNWNNAPASDATMVASLGTVAVGNWYSLDLTSFITSDGFYTFRVTSTSTNGADYSSKEGANPPQLEIIVSNDPTSTPGTITPSTTPTITSTPTRTIPPTNTFTPGPSATPLPLGTSRFAVIGDFGTHDQAEADVAALVNSWNPDFIVTVGDNNYPLGGADTIDVNVGKDYHAYIYPYTGIYGAGATTNRFFPALGNHDMDTGLGQPSIDYFALPGNERYYDFVQGPLHFFILNSDPRELDGTSSNSTQGQWLQSRMAASTTPWQIVVFHHAPYSSGAHGSSTFMRWPFKEWGADAVFSGHDHTYERLIVNGLPYFVNGLGGASIYNFPTQLPESQVRYNSDWGAMLVDGNSNQLTFQFFSRAGVLVDSYTLTNSSPATLTPTSTSTATNTPAGTPTGTFTLMPTSSATSTATATATNVPTATNTFTSTPTSTPTLTLTNTSSPTATATQTRTPTPTPSAIPDLIFADGFESGTLSAWSSAQIDGGDLGVLSGAALTGQFGLAALIDDRRAIFVTDSLPDAETSYRVRFYADPNSLTISSTPLVVFNGISGSSTQVIRIEMRKSGGSFQLQAGLRNDINTWYSTGWTTITDASHSIEIFWLASTAPEANSGEITFWIDGTQAGRLTGIDNDKRHIDLVHLGVLAGIESATRGTVFFDAFESHRSTYIGPAAP